MSDILEAEVRSQLARIGELFWPCLSVVALLFWEMSGEGLGGELFRREAGFIIPAGGGEMRPLKLVTR